MPNYDFRCAGCEHVFQRTLAVTQSDKPSECPACGDTADRTVGAVGFVLRGDGWAGKNLTLATQMKQKNARLSQKVSERRVEDTMRLIPNVDGERTDTWKDAQRLAASKGKVASTYEQMVQKEARKKS